MNSFRRLGSLLGFSLLSGGGSWLVSGLFLAMPAVAQANVARIYSVDGGTIQLRRHNWSTFYDTYPQTTLNRTDQLRVTPGVDAVLLCPNGLLRGPVRAGDSNVGSTCFGMPESVRRDWEITERWGAVDETVPYVISPWRGVLLTDVPDLRWNAVPGCVEPYEVSLQKWENREWVTVWTVETTASSMAYPSEQSGLEPRTEYRLRVTVDGVELPEAAGTGRFSLMGERASVRVESAIAAVDAWEVDETTKTLALVDGTYSPFELYYRGIEELTALVSAGQGSAGIYRRLGEYYSAIGLALPAIESYRAAAELAGENENLEEEVLAALGLGTVYGRIEETEAAEEYLRQAQVLAIELGDADLIGSIEAELLRVTTVSGL